MVSVQRSSASHSLIGLSLPSGVAGTWLNARPKHAIRQYKT